MDFKSDLMPELILIKYLKQICNQKLPLLTADEQKTRSIYSHPGT